MIERTVLAAIVMGVIGFSVFRWMITNGWTERSARNSLLLLMVLFENVHIGNCRSETTSALKLSPLNSPILLTGVVCAFLIHVAAMYTPWGQAVLDTEPVNLMTWAVLLGLALLMLPAMELHKLWRAVSAESATHHGKTR
jgi:magnesium-transporting ATPase (P-type)